jgi:hypothetical protein
LADRKKVLKAAVVAAVILVPVAAAAWYFWPRDISIYVYGKGYPVTYAIFLEGERVVEGSWNGTNRAQESSPLLHFAKKTAPGPDFELGASMNGGAPVKARYSVFDGTDFMVFLDEEVYVVQTRIEPVRPG